MTTIDSTRGTAAPESAAAVEKAPDAEYTADAAMTNALLRCWLRETATPVPGPGELRLALPNAGTSLDAEVVYRSPTGQHRFGDVRLPGGVPLDAVTIAGLLATEATTGSAGPGAAATERSARARLSTDVVARVADSQQRATHHLSERARYPEASDAATPFLSAEQALLLGHPLHPTPKSRIGWTDSEAEAYSPELRGSFRLHWFAADESVTSSDGRARERLAGHAPHVPEGTTAIPAHPWQAREISSRPGVRELIDAGLLRDLGPSGARWFPTASIRTVYNPDAGFMLKFSLGLRITNSKRENLRKELRRGAEIDRVLDAGLGAEISATYPRFAIVRDPAWLAVDPHPGAMEQDDDAISGLEVVLRENPFGSIDNVACVAGLLAENPVPGGDGQHPSALARVVSELSERTGTTPDEVARLWCARYFDEVVAPVLWLYREFGLGLEAHQQNTLVYLDDAGWPCGGRYRDNQGYYISPARGSRLAHYLPGVGVHGDNLVDEHVIDERLGYYIGINNLAGVVGAFGAQGIADERGLLAVFRERLRGFADLPLASTLAEAPTLRCKANLLTRTGGLDELVGPLETQSVYVDIENPFTNRHRSDD